MGPIMNEGKPSPAFDVFLSHASEDNEAVRAFARRLDAAGQRVWLDEERMPPGFEPREAIQQGIAASRSVLVWITEHWLGKSWTRWELKLFAEAESRGGRVIPVLHVPWDNGVLGPYLTESIAINPDVNEDERLWLAICGIELRAPGDRSQWANKGRAFATPGSPAVGPTVREAAPPGEQIASTSEGQGATRNLWQLRNPARVVFVVSASSSAATGEYNRPATGIGQVRGLAYAICSLSRAYHDLEIRNIYLSTEPLQDRREQDLIILGGPKNNRVSGEFLAELADVQPADQRGSTLLWRKRSNDEWTGEDAEEFHGETSNDMVHSDYGLIVRARNPFTNADRTAVLLAGSHTHGTMAAAKFFIENLIDEDPDVTDELNLSILVECSVRDGYPISVKIKRKHYWRRDR